MSAITKYEIEFVERTKDLLNNNFSDFQNKDKEVTFLLNCLLGLIITVSENEKRSNLTFKGKIDDTFLSNIPDKVGFIKKTRNNIELTDNQSTEIKTNVGHKTDLKDCTKLWFVNKLRNGIAHQNIEGINDNGKWIGLKLWNTNNDLKDFEIIFTIEELKNLALSIADEYIKSKKPKEKQRKPAHDKGLA